MYSIKADRIGLLDKIKNNREKHRSLFLKAQEGFRKQVIEELDGMLDDARKGNPVRLSVRLPEPIDHTQDYDRVIAMLEMHTSNTIDIGATEFDNYVLDRWPWSGLAASVNTAYSDGGRPQGY